jgi:Flp pilus assembly protein TadD
VAALALLLTVAYGGALRAGVAWDDLEILSGNPAIKTLTRPWRFFTDSSTIGPLTEAWLSQYRPLRTLGFALQFAVFGGAAWGYHLVSLLLHALGALAVGRLTRAMIGRGGWLAAAIWLVHPALSEDALSLAAQGNLQCLLLAALAATWHLEWLERASPWRRAASLAAALGAMLAYESGVLVPGLVVVAELVWRLEHGRPPRHWLARHAPFWVLFAAFLTVRQLVTAPIPAQAWWGGTWSASLVMQLRVWTEGWHLTVFPAGMPVRYKPSDIPALITPGVAVAFHLVIAALAARAAYLRQARAFLAALAWWYVAQAPTSNLIVPNPGYPFAPRFLFLGLVVVTAVAAAALDRLARQRPAVAVLLGGAALLAVAADRTQTRIWQNSGTVFGAMARHDPGDFGAQFNLGWFELRCGDLPAAAEHFERAAVVNPKDGRPEYWLGEAARLAGRGEQARSHLVRSLEIERRQIEPRVSLAELEIADRRYDRALAWLAPIPETARQKGPAAAPLELTLAGIAAGQGACRDAEERSLRALSFPLTSSRSTFVAASVLRHCGRRDEALGLFRQSAELASAEYVQMVGEASVLP